MSGICEEMDDLAEGVDAGVSPATGVAVGDSAGELAEGVFEGLLDRAEAGLTLPAVEVGAVVGEGELEVPHERRGGKRNATPL